MWLLRAECQLVEPSLNIYARSEQPHQMVQRRVWFMWFVDLADLIPSGRDQNQGRLSNWLIQIPLNNFLWTPVITKIDELTPEFDDHPLLVSGLVDWIRTVIINPLIVHRYDSIVATTTSTSQKVPVYIHGWCSTCLPRWFQANGHGTLVFSKKLVDKMQLLGLDGTKQQQRRRMLQLRWPDDSQDLVNQESRFQWRLPSFMVDLWCWVLGFFL